MGRRRRARADRQPNEHTEDAVEDERTSPFPYAENFDEWVADEAADRDNPENS